MGPISVDLAGGFTRAHAMRADQAVEVRRDDGRTRFILTTLRDYEVVVLE
jgi:hypothetical protein